MQRCFFFFCFFLSGFFARAQQGDVLVTEWSLWYQPSAPALKATCLLDIRPEGSSSIILDFRPDSIIYIRYREGRLKEEVPYSRTGNQLQLELDEEHRQRKSISLEFSYTIDISKPENQGYIAKSERAFALNPFNIADPEIKLGMSGMFFPAMAGDPSLYRVNITLPESMNSGTKGELGFIVDHQDGTASHFWNSPAPYIPEQFFLIIGDFKEFDREEIKDEYYLLEMNAGELKVFRTREQISSFLTFLEDYIPTQPDKEYLLKLDSLSEQPLPDFYITPEDITAAVPRDQFSREQGLALSVTKGDTARASYLHFLFNAEREGEAWKNGIMTRKWNLAGKGFVPQEVLQVQIREWLRSYNEDVHRAYVRGDRESGISPNRLQYIRELQQSGQPPHISVSYRYRNNTQMIFIDQDTARAGLYRLLPEVSIYGSDTTIREILYTDNRVQDTLLFTLAGSPQAVKVDFGLHFPGYVTDNSPDIYNLYLLSHAGTDEERFTALRKLFQTENANLLSTALGIAMDDKNSAIRMEALDNAGNLNVPARLKLKDTILNLAGNDPDAGVREKAKQLAVKYYGNK